MRGAFVCKQLLFAFNAPAIATELAMIAYEGSAYHFVLYVH